LDGLCGVGWESKIGEIRTGVLKRKGIVRCRKLEKVECTVPLTKHAKTELEWVFAKLSNSSLGHCRVRSQRSKFLLKFIETWWSFRVNSTMRIQCSQKLVQL
jgi:hypothetical protein